MKVLIITYYWPPAGGSGVQRWLKFVKYFSDFGITPVVYTVENPNYPILDESLQKEIPDHIEILKLPILEPNQILGKNTQRSAGFLDPDPGGIGKILQYIRANYFIPDARKFWVKPSIKFLSKYLKTSNIDMVITTGPPHSLHMIGMALQSRFNLKWMADFRDPWTEIDYFHQLPLTKRSFKKHVELEKHVLNKADAVLVVGKTMKENFKQFNDQIHVITNGFDREPQIEAVELDKKFTVTHVGMMNSDRNPTFLWNVLADLLEENSDLKKYLKVQLIGKITDEVSRQIENLGIKDFVSFYDYMPYDEVLKFQRSSQVLLLAVNKVPGAKGIITGKVFEYLNAKRPILAIAPVEGDLSEIVAQTNSGEVVGFEDDLKLKNTIMGYFEKFKQGDLNVNSKNIDQFHRKELTKKLSVLIKDLRMK